MFRTLKFGLAATALVAAASLAAPAFAGECPPNQRMVDATKPATHAAKGVTDTVIGRIDLEKEKLALKGHQLRLRRLVIQPGGIVPWHSHDERPAVIYIVSGEIYEYASNCKVPILHKAGETAVETRGVAHWWQNKGRAPVVLLSADIWHDPSDKNM
jgi:quercetin dioxygenase-like cupin family protein